MRRYSPWLVLFVVLVLGFAVGCQQSAGDERLGRTQQAGTVCTAAAATLSINAPNSNPQTPAQYASTLKVDALLTGSTSTTPTGTITITEPTTNLSCQRPLSPVTVPSQAFLPGKAQALTNIIADCGKLLPASIVPYVVTVSYPGDGTYCPQSTSVNLYVVKADTVTTLSFVAPQTKSIVYGQPLSFSSTVSFQNADPAAAALGGVPQGTVRLVDFLNQNETDFDTTLSNSMGSFSPTLDYGNHQVTSAYLGSGNANASSYDGSYFITINTASSSVTNPTVSPDPAPVGATITFRATISPVSPSQVMPHGTVYFYYFDPSAVVLTGGEDPEACHSNVIDAKTGEVSCTTTTIPEGNWATYAELVADDDGRFFGSGSDDSTDFTVTSKASFTVTLTSSADAATTYYGTPVTFTATINTTGADPTGTVSFYRSDDPTNAIAVSLSTTNGVTSATTSPMLLTGGTWTVKAVYLGDDAHQNPDSCDPVTKVCSPTPGTDTHAIFIAAHDTSTLLGISSKVGSASSPVYGQTLTLKADVAPTATPTMDAKSLAPAGTVFFYDGACLNARIAPSVVTEIPVPVCLAFATAPLANGSATVDVANLAIGPHDIRAVFSSTDGNYGGSSATQSRTIAPAPTNTAIATSSATELVNTPVTLSATITVASPGAVGGVSPTTPSASDLEEGTVTFKEGATTVGTGTLDGTQSTATQRVYTFTTSMLSAGLHTITATYSGGAHFTSSTSAGLDEIIRLDGVSATIVSSGNPSTFGVDVSFTATLTSTIGGTPTGTITFSEGATTLGTATLTEGVGSITVTKPAAGIHTITLSYSGDATHPAGALKIFTQTVQPAPTTMTLASSANPVQPGQTATLTAHLTSAQSSVPVTGNVTFSEGASTLGTSAISAGNATFAAGALSVGPHLITATFAGNTSFGPSTASLTLSVNIGGSALSLATSLTPSLAGADVTFTATVTAVAPATGTPTGLVKFVRGGVALGTVSLTATGTASLTTNNLAIGANTITATYQGDASFGTSEGTLAQNVATNAAKIVLSTAPAPTSFGQSVTIKATLTGSAGTPTGTVTFKNGATSLGSATVAADGTASFTTGLLPVGTQTLTGLYSGSVDYAGGAASVTHVVNKAATQVAVTASANPAKAGEAITFNATVTADGAVVEGDVEVLNGAVSLGIITLSAGHATYTTDQIPAGTHTVTIKYKGNDSFEASTTTLSLVVDPAPSTSSGSSSSGAPPGSSGGPSGTPNTSGGLGITPSADGGGGDDCAVSNVGGPSTTGVSGGLGLVIALAAALRRRRRAA